MSVVPICFRYWAVCGLSPPTSTSIPRSIPFPNYIQSNEFTGKKKKNAERQGIDSSTVLHVLR